MIFSDLIYGQIELPDWLMPFIKSPEFLRLRGVRLSNVDSFQFKDFNAPTRWEHGIAVAYLATKYSEFKKLNRTDSVHLCLAALLHDISTPPFAHTLENVLESFNHEVESSKLLSIESGDNIKDQFTVFASQYPQFEKICKMVNSTLKLSINPDEVAKIIIGEGELGYVINGNIDLDNIDNVTRSSLFMGIEIDKNVPLKLVRWLAEKNERPFDIHSETNVAVKSWIGYRNKMYDLFYNSTSEELGRQAFLQHILRRAHAEGLSKQSMIYNTEDSLLHQISTIDETKNTNENRITLKDLVQSYILLESTFKIAEIPIETKEDLILFCNPLFAEWLEEILTFKYFEPFVFINSRRFQTENTELFPPIPGSILIFKLHTANFKIEQLPKWIQGSIQDQNTQTNLSKSFRNVIINMIKTEKNKKSWLNLTRTRMDNIKNNLDAVGSWSFKLSRNETIHSYPATFVHAIPSSLIASLGLQGETILDPFGGAGQTAIEGIKQGCKVITADCNSIASLISKVKLTYMSIINRKFIQAIDLEVIKIHNINSIPKFENPFKWHNKKTFEELCRLRCYIFSLENDRPEVAQFLKLCFSDILTSTTARKGKDYAYFADNTPLPKGQKTPEYVNAYSLFLQKVEKNLRVIERLYSTIERKGKSVEEDLKKAAVFQLNITESSYKEFKIPENSISGIITSPPYLCMVDYTYGNRLSYYWLFPDDFEKDFKLEIGSRRCRTVKGIKERYLSDLKKFARNASELLKENGFLCMVVGTPTAVQFKNIDLFKEIDNVFEKEGFIKFWTKKRQIHWHRNPGLGKLKSERISVYVNAFQNKTSESQVKSKKAKP